MWRHPKYYKELRKLRNKAARIPPTSSGQAASDQVISKQQATASGERSPGPGLKRQASSTKLQAPKPEPSSGSSNTL